MKHTSRLYDFSKRRPFLAVVALALSISLLSPVAAAVAADTMPAHERVSTAQTAITAPTRFVEANGIRFAYRRFGKPGKLPLIFNQHLAGTLDNWDPAVLDSLAKEREVIIFDNAGVGA